MKTNKSLLAHSLPPILLIDDDPHVLTTLQRLGESLNSLRLVLHLDPGTATNAVADPTIGLIVCDYRFPNASGVAFMESVRQRGISTPVLFISGSPDSGAVVRSCAIRHSAFLQKPFTLRTFRDALFHLLDETHPPQKPTESLQSKSDR